MLYAGAPLFRLPHTCPCSELTCSDGTQVQDPYYTTLSSHFPGALTLLRTQEAPAGIDFISTHVTTLEAINNGSSSGTAVPKDKWRLVMDGLMDLGGLSRWRGDPSERVVI